MHHLLLIQCPSLHMDYTRVCDDFASSFISGSDASSVGVSSSTFSNFLSFKSIAASPSTSSFSSSTPSNMFLRDSIYFFIRRFFAKSASCRCCCLSASIFFNSRCCVFANE
eukprot:84469_1